MSDAPRDPPITMNDPPIRLAVCVSGGGTTLGNLLEKIAAGQLRAEVVRVVASKPGIRAIERAEAAEVPVSLVVRGLTRASMSSAPRSLSRSAAIGPTWSSWAVSWHLSRSPPTMRGGSSTSTRP